MEENSINGFVIANEVLDALPVERLTFSKGKLYRQVVAVNEESGRFFFYKNTIKEKLEKAFSCKKN